MHTLIVAGYARPSGLGRPVTSSDIWEQFGVDLGLDFIYGEIVKGLDPQQVADIDKQLAEMPDPRVNHTRRVTREDGSTVHVSQARLEQILANHAALGSMRHKIGDEV